MSFIPAPRRPDVAPLAEGLLSRSFRPGLSPDEKTADAATASFNRAVGHGFYEAWGSDEQIARSTRAFIEDEQLQTGVYREPDGEANPRRAAALPSIVTDAEFGADRPVGTFVDFDKTLSTGGPLGPVPARMISGVTVNPGYRRRGILKHMMTDALARSVDDGIPLAALTVSEGSIYGRFGFGAATRAETIRVHTGHGPEKYTPRHPVSGRVRETDPTKLGPVIDDVFARFHAATRGSLGRPAAYRHMSTGQWSPRDIASWDRDLRAAVHVTEDGGVGGYVVFAAEEDSAEGRTVRVRDLIAVDALCASELWRYLSALDLVERVVQGRAPVSNAIRHAATNPRAITTTAVEDMVWLRLLDISACLRHRQWNADGRIRLQISDGLGISDGLYEVTVAGGAAEVEQLEPGEHPGQYPGEQSAQTAEREGGRAGAYPVPSLGMSVETLGSIYLGDVSLQTLHAVGRIDATHADIAAASAVVDLPTPPYCATFF